MGRINAFLLAGAILVCAGMASAQTCPAFVRKVNITQYLDSGAVLPVKGTVVAGANNGGLYTSSLDQDNPTLIPNTTGDHTTSTQITEDGQWVLYNSGGVKLIRIDGQFKTSVPATNPSGSDGSCTFWWSAPSGKLEVVYRENGDKVVHAVPVTFSASAAPTFGTDHIIAQFNEQCEFSMGCARNHFFTRIDDAHYAPKMVTLPATGAATDADFYVPANNDFPAFGCMCSITHDGYITCNNAGYDQWCGCMADEFCLLRHKSFILLPFQEKTAPAVGYQAVLEKTMAVSVNWAPKKYLFLNPKDSTHGQGSLSSNFWSDFKDWCYSNDTSYLVGDGDCLAYGNCNPPDSCAGSRFPDSGTIWLVHYPTNTWTMVLHLTGGKRLSHPAVWINPSVGTISPLHGNRLQYRSVPLEGIRYYYDIRGRRVGSNALATKKFYSGVYYIVTPDGIMKRVVVGGN